jgi:hypothetical protein
VELISATLEMPPRPVSILVLQHGGVVDGDSVVTRLVVGAAEGWKKGLWRLEKNVSVDGT